MATRDDAKKMQDVFNILVDIRRLKHKKLYDTLLLIMNDGVLREINRIHKSRSILNAIAYYEKHKSFSDDILDILEPIISKYRVAIVRSGLMR